MATAIKIIDTSQDNADSLNEQLLAYLTSVSLSLSDVHVITFGHSFSRGYFVIHTT